MRATAERTAQAAQAAATRARRETAAGRLQAASRQRLAVLRERTRGERLRVAAQRLAAREAEEWQRQRLRRDVRGALADARDRSATEQEAAREVAQAVAMEEPEWLREAGRLLVEPGAGTEAAALVESRALAESVASARREERVRLNKAVMEESKRVARAESRSLAEAIVGRGQEPVTPEARLDAGAQRLQAMLARRTGVTGREPQADEVVAAPAEQRVRSVSRRLAFDGATQVGREATGGRGGGGHKAAP